MKKILTILTLIVLLTGCATSSNQSFLDEKIKCKKLANERIEDLHDDYSSIGSRVELAQAAFYKPKSTCIIEYVITPFGESISGSNKAIEDILTGETLAWFGGATIKYWPDEEEKAQMWIEEDQKFNDKVKLYFNEDAN